MSFKLGSLPPPKKSRYPQDMPQLPLLIFSLSFLAGCATQNPTPSLLVGNFEDDYGIQYTISEKLWHQKPDAKYHIVAWHPKAQYLIAQNDTANTSGAGLWTRIDWVELSGMPPYKWAFCLSAYKAATREEAEAANVANRDTPKSGCNGYPFSRMRARSN